MEVIKLLIEACKSSKFSIPLLLTSIFKLGLLQIFMMLYSYNLYIFLIETILPSIRYEQEARDQIHLSAYLCSQLYESPWSNAFVQEIIKVILIQKMIFWFNFSLCPVRSFVLGVRTYAYSWGIKPNKTSKIVKKNPKKQKIVHTYDPVIDLQRRQG